MFVCVLNFLKLQTIVPKDFIIIIIIFVVCIDFYTVQLHLLIRIVSYDLNIQITYQMTNKD